MPTEQAAAAQLTAQQHRDLFDHGYTLLPGVIPPERVAAALRAINHSLGEEGMNKTDLPRMRAQSYCPELNRAPAIVDLFNATDLFLMAESALGRGKLRRPDSGQIALRFPNAPGSAASEGATSGGGDGGLHPHLDGMSTPLNGVKSGTIGHFTMLAAVFLSDLPEPDSGNFTIWPGTHRQYEAWFRQHGPQSLLDGMPPIQLPPAHQITARAGDAALVHYQVAHTAALNRSPHVRYAVFFRLTHVDHASFGWDVMTQIWTEWVGLREAVGERTLPDKRFLDFSASSALQTIMTFAFATMLAAAPINRRGAEEEEDAEKRLYK